MVPKLHSTSCISRDQVAQTVAGWSSDLLSLCPGHRSASWFMGYSWMWNHDFLDMDKWNATFMIRERFDSSATWTGYIRRYSPSTYLSIRYDCRYEYDLQKVPRCGLETISTFSDNIHSATLPTAAHSLMGLSDVLTAVQKLPPIST